MISLFIYWLNPLIYIFCLYRALCLCREKMNGPQKKSLQRRQASGRNLCSHERPLASLSLHCPWMYACNTVERQARQLLILFAVIRQIWLLRKINPRTDPEAVSWECSIVLRCFGFTVAMLRPGLPLYFYSLLDTALSGQRAHFPLCYSHLLGCVQSWSFASRWRQEVHHQLQINSKSCFSIRSKHRCLWKLPLLGFLQFWYAN